MQISAYRYRLKNGNQIYANRHIAYVNETIQFISVASIMLSIINTYSKIGQINQIWIYEFKSTIFNNSRDQKFVSKSHIEGYFDHIIEKI